MAYGTAIRQGLRIAGKIDKKYNLNKIFIDKYFPPGYRKTAHKIVDIAGTFGGGYGLYRFAQSLYAPDSPGNDAIPEQRFKTTTSKSYKTRSRQPARCRIRRSRFQERNYRKRYSRFS